LFVAVATLSVACGSEGSGGGLPKDLPAAVAALQARPEHTADSVEVQHILIAFQGAARATVTRSKAEAEKLTGEIYARALGGEDFTKLMKEFSTDPGPGTYPMTKQTRSQMVAGFGDVGWRLQVGEIGIAPYDQAKSPFGWHIIKRLK
jgi:parvulin-like peptidyl-prolyl isomerase